MNRILILLFSVVVATTHAQSFADLKTPKGRNAYDNAYTNWMLRYTSISGKGTESIGGLTVNASVAEVDCEVGETSIYWENAWLGDLIWRVAHFKESTTNAQVFTSGLLGWFQFYYNVYVQERLLVAPGLSTGDYIFGNNTAYTLEPNGYYIHVGPAVKVSYLLNDKFWIDSFLNWDIGAGVKHSNDRSRYERVVGYPRPFFVNLNINICSTSNLFAGLRVNQLLDRGDNHLSATRVDISLGYRALRFK